MIFNKTALFNAQLKELKDLAKFVDLKIIVVNKLDRYHSSFYKLLLELINALTVSNESLECNIAED